ncbi:MAG TPA: hypothetical protein VKN14_09940, partial [Flavobacteriaceae bacterium]|nr:hypothetical protein [Flavobacteriaceae bacterium]
MLKIIKIKCLLFLLIIYSTSCSNDDVISNTGNEDDVIGVSSSSLFKILNPTRGSLLNYEAIDETYPVEGEVCDSINDISNIFINDEAVTFDNNVCNFFNTEVNHSLGLNVIKGRSVNNQGNEVLVVQSNISSNEYYNSEENNIGIPSSFRLRLDQKMIDKIATIMRSELNLIVDDVMEDFIP